MRVITNRIVVSIALILVAAALWEFVFKPATGPLYTAAVAEYKGGNYQRSLALLQEAYYWDSNDAAVLALTGWNYLKLGNPKTAEDPYFRRAYLLSPQVLDIILGYAYTKIELDKLDEAARLLGELRARGADDPDSHMAWAAFHRKGGRNREAADEFLKVLAMDSDNALAIKNLQELYNVSGSVQDVKAEFQPFLQPEKLTYLFRAEGEHFAALAGEGWKPVYLTGVSLTPTLPGFFPVAGVTDPAVYTDWLHKIQDLGVNTIRMYTILPPAFYRALNVFNRANPQRPLWLLQGVSFGDPSGRSMFDPRYMEACQREIRNAIDLIHGQGDVPFTRARSGGIYNYSVAPWVVGLVLGDTWLSHVVTENNQLNPDVRSFRGTYVQVPSGSPTEVFLARMLESAAEYEEKQYNWQRPLAFANWPTLDPMRHPTESTMLEEVSIRRALGERLPTPPGPYDDDDGVSLNPTRLQPTERLTAGYFAAYSTFPFYPDFVNREPRYLAVQDSEGSNPFLGYLRDLKANHRGVPLLITDYGIPTSLGIGHFNPAGFNEGGKTEIQQGELLARFTRNIYEAGAAGGFVFEWVDQWFRESWIQRWYAVPRERRIFWTNLMDPAGHFGLMAADPHRRSVRLLRGTPEEWTNISPLYSETAPPLVQPLNDRFDPARDLKALYADADEGFLYVRLVLGKLDNDNDGQPDWNNAHYLIGLGTVPGRAGLTYLPFITPIRFSMGMTYAIQLAGPAASRIWIASAYNPFQITSVEGIPAQTVLASKLGWKPAVTDTGTFEAQVIEPNRRRFGRDGTYFPPQRYDRGILRYGSLDATASDHDSLAEWNANVQTNTVDLRIPWNLLNVTDPSSHQVFAGLDKDGTVETVETPGFVVVAFSMQPREGARLRPIMEQGHPIVDALPGMEGPTRVRADALKSYRWTGWSFPRYELRLKESYAVLRRAFQSLPAAPAPAGRPAEQIAKGVRGSPAAAGPQ